MNFKIADIQGIGPGLAELLAAASISTTRDLLALCSTPTGRRQVAERTGIGENQLLKWANLADLMRISGIGPRYSVLFENVGVDSVEELSTHDAANLTVQMAAVNLNKHLGLAPPSEKTVGSWIREARNMALMVTN